MVLAEVQENDHDRHCRPGEESQHSNLANFHALHVRPRHARLQCALQAGQIWVLSSTHG